MKKKVLVTGSSGFIASYVVPVLKDKGYIAVAFDLKNGNDIFDEKLDFAVSISDFVIHLAALTSVKDSRKHPKQYLRTNTLGTSRMLELCLKHKKKLVYVSSAAVEDPNSSPYAESKFLAEELVKSFMEYMPVVILRPENVYGKGMKKGTLLYNFLHDKVLKIDGIGKQERDYINVLDVANIIVASLDKSWNGKMVSVGTGKTSSVNSIANLVQKLSGKKVVYEKRNNAGIHKSCADIRELKKLYRGQLVTNLAEDIRRMYGQ